MQGVARVSKVSRGCQTEDSWSYFHDSTVAYLARPRHGTLLTIVIISALMTLQMIHLAEKRDATEHVLVLRSYQTDLGHVPQSHHTNQGLVPQSYQTDQGLVPQSHQTYLKLDSPNHYSKRETKTTDVLEGPTFTAVVLLAYFRSGSSLTGNILEQNNDVFYLFEPLRTLYNLKKNKKPLTFMNGTMSPYGEYNITEVSVQILTGWLTCNFEMINKESFISNADFFAFGKKTKTFVTCVSKVGRQRFFSNWSMDSSCMVLLKELCMTSKYRIIKTIRTSMTVGAKILSSIPDSKMVHLIRDPRATVESQRHRHKCSPVVGGVVKCATFLCNRMARDTVVRKTFRKVYPDRILAVRYESIVDNTTKTTRLMYDFIGMNVTHQVTKYVNRLVHGKNQNGCEVCKKTWQLSHNKASTRTEAWKTSLSKSMIEDIQKRCKAVIRFYRYSIYNTGV